MGTDPCSVLTGGGQFGEEDLASPVVSSLLYNCAHGITPARLKLLGETHRQVNKNTHFQREEAASATSRLNCVMGV